MLADIGRSDEAILHEPRVLRSILVQPIDLRRLPFGLCLCCRLLLGFLLRNQRVLGIDIATMQHALGPAREGLPRIVAGPHHARKGIGDLAAVLVERLIERVVTHAEHLEQAH